MSRPLRFAVYLPGMARPVQEFSEGCAPAWLTARPHEYVRKVLTLGVGQSADLYPARIERVE